MTGHPIQIQQEPMDKFQGNYKLILGSNSPRRVEYLKQMGLKFTQRVVSIDESYPQELKGHRIAEYLAKRKADVQQNLLSENEILLTSDTVVWCNGESLEKAINKDEAIHMLTKLSDKSHEVITAICLTTTNKQIIKHQTTSVWFNKLSKDQIAYYVDNFNPFDKAGAYGIQDWIGLIGISKIEGSYSSVVGLPTSLLYSTLKIMTTEMH